MYLDKHSEEGGFSEKLPRHLSDWSRDSFFCFYAVYGIHV
ncbi:hypothetical protein BMQ_pBM30035 (plasmid) [Priestia megaterium QM B1551]|uniref:Uncharacterized protein n=1 Tax=Priestia megaterium (strain ATCC 12872 / QMB1551) TaxID=545693 RepID=D5E3C2_PRIM1|nr:hypothetical protein BMQ_pBM30035 [Priestia megaterium QM B1551]